MFHGVIHKITLAQFFLRHGVVLNPFTHAYMHTYTQWNRQRYQTYTVRMNCRHTAGWLLPAAVDLCQHTLSSVLATRIPAEAGFEAHEDSGVVEIIGAVSVRP